MPHLLIASFCKIQKVVFNILKTPIAKDASIYTIINILEKGIPFLILPIISRYISKEDMGLWMLFQSVYLVLLPLMSLNLNSTILINYYQLNVDDLKSYLKQIYFYSTVLFAFSLLMTFSFGSYWADVVGFSKGWQLLFCFTIYFEQLFSLYANLLRMNKQSVNYGKLIVSYSLFQNILSLLLVLFTDLGWKGLIYGKSVSLFVFFWICIYRLREQKLLGFSYQINKVVLKDVCRISLPTSIHQIGAWAGNSINRLIVNFLIGKAATGSYGIAATFSVIVGVIQDALNKAYVPFLYETLVDFGNDSAKSKLRKVGVLYYILIILLSALFAVTGYFSIGFIFGESYVESRGIVIPLVFAMAFNGMYKIHANYIFFSKQVIKITTVTLVTGVLNCVLSWFMIKYYSIWGAAYAFLIVNIITYVWVFIIANKMYPIFGNH